MSVALFLSSRAMPDEALLCDHRFLRLHRAPIPEEEPLPGEEPTPDEEEQPPHPDPSVEQCEASA